MPGAADQLQRHPAGLGNFKLAIVALTPLGKEIISIKDPRAVNGTVSF
jgi:uncharacterized membrane protein YccF (DUF307 family)